MHRLLMFLIFVITLFILPLTIAAGDGKELFEAVKEGSTEKVDKLIDDGADVNSTDTDGAAPLYYAVSAGDAEMVRLLLEGGADPDRFIIPEGPAYPWGGDALSLALSLEHDGIADILLQYGADPALEDRYFDYQIQKSLFNKDARRLESLLHRADGRGPDLPLLLFYRNAGLEVRKTIERFIPEISADGADVLRMVLELEERPQFFYFPAPEINFPLASSYLSDSDTPGRYASDKAFDGKLASSWVEGVPGPGIGQRIVFELRREAARIEIYPGYGDSRFFLPNNRLKKASLSVKLLTTAPTERADVYEMRELLLKDLHFDDRQEFQGFTIDLPEIRIPPEFSKIIAVLEIRDVYPGSRWDDTCIAEIRIR